MPKPLLPFQPVSTERKMQININSEDDAKAVIQHLGKIKSTFSMLADTAGVVSIEFCIAASIRRKVETTLTGAIPWCKTWVKSVAPFEGNVHYPLPHFVPAPMPVKTIASVSSCEATPPVKAEPPTEKPNRYLPNGPVPPLSLESDSTERQPIGKSKRPVPADKPVG